MCACLALSFAMLGFLSGTRSEAPSTSNLTSPEVFNPVYYVNHNPDLINIASEQEAADHWLSVGINQGRQGCGAFHSKQYIIRYPDLKLNNNYTAAILDYLTTGRASGRVGYMDVEYDGRLTLSDGKDLFLSASRRMGGAIDSVVWNNYEFLNVWDHGRELQMAVTSPPYGECFNPTEAGGRDDGSGNSTLTKIYYFETKENTLMTTVHPAFWLRPGDHETQPSQYPQCTNGSKAYNSETVYLYDMSKTVTIGCGSSDICIKFESQISVDGTWPPHDYIQFESPTGYLSLNFTSIYSVNTTLKKLVPQNASLPVVLSTPYRKYAMGAYAPSGQFVDFPVTYGGMKFKEPSFADTTNKWNVVFKKKVDPPTVPAIVQYTVYICLGTLEMTTNCIINMSKLYPHV